VTEGLGGGRPSWHMCNNLLGAMAGSMAWRLRISLLQILTRADIRPIPQWDLAQHWAWHWEACTIGS
jgi:hypothetical protein